MIYIIIENKKYYLDTCRITGRNLKLYIKISYFLNQKFQGIEINEEEFKRLKAEFITSFLVKKITVGYLLKNAIEEDLDIAFNLLFNFLFNVKKIDSLILKLFPQKKEVKKNNAFEEYDLENGYVEEISNDNYLNIINALYSIGINRCNSSYYELENKIDWYYFLEYLNFEINIEQEISNDSDSKFTDETKEGGVVFV